MTDAEAIDDQAQRLGLVGLVTLPLVFIIAFIMMLARGRATATLAELEKVRGHSVAPEHREALVSRLLRMESNIRRLRTAGLRALLADDALDVANLDCFEEADGVFCTAPRTDADLHRRLTACYRFLADPDAAILRDFHRLQVRALRRMMMKTRAHHRLAPRSSSSATPFLVAICTPAPARGPPRPARMMKSHPPAALQPPARSRALASSLQQA
jgi:hypothetical protein